MKRLIRGTAMAAVAGALGIAIAIGGHTTVGADTATPTIASCPAPQGNQGDSAIAGFTSGTIASVSGATFTLTRQDNFTVAVRTDGSTAVIKAVPSGVGTIATGDFVMVQGMASGTNFAATTVFDNGAQLQAGNAPGGSGQFPALANGAPPVQLAGCTPAPGQPPQGQRPPQGQQGQQQPAALNGANDGTAVTGTVQQISGTTFTVNTVDGTTLTVTTDGSTKVTTWQQGAVSDLQVGDQVDVMADPQGSTASNASFTATMISDRTPH